MTHSSSSQSRKAVARTARGLPRAVCLAAAASQFLWLAAAATPPSRADYRNEVLRKYPMEKPLERWELEENRLSGRIIQAREITKSDKPVAGIPPCGFPRPVFWSAAGGIVVDRNYLTDLTVVHARRSRELGPEGAVVGRVLDTKRDPRQVVKLLVLAGVVDANIHVVATVSLMEEGRDPQGYWCRLISDDRFWTNSENRVVYDFAVRVSTEGEIRLMHVNHVGQSKGPLIPE